MGLLTSNEVHVYTSGTQLEHPAEFVKFFGMSSSSTPFGIKEANFVAEKSDRLETIWGCYQGYREQTHSTISSENLVTVSN